MNTSHILAIKTAFLECCIARVKARRETGDAANATMSPLSQERGDAAANEIGHMAASTIIRNAAESWRENPAGMMLYISPINENWDDVIKMARELTTQ